MFLENLREEGNSYVYSCFVENQLVHIRYEGEEEEEERLCNDLKVDTKMLNGLPRKDKTRNLANTRSDSMREQTGGSMESQQSLETERGPCNRRPHQDVSSVPNINCRRDVQFDDVDEDYQLFLNSCRTDDDSLVYMDSELIGKSSNVRQNSQVSDQAFDTPKLECDVDEDYQLILNSARIVDGDLVYMPDRNITTTCKMEGGSNSSDPDLILLEPDQICENTPFISSKTYDSSWFESEMNPRDSRKFSAYDNSQFRKRLMEYLERPYDQEECVVILNEVRRQRQKERHVETRQGVVKSYCTDGVNKSYLQLYPDLGKAIAKFKEPHRVLFLLRGFLFWLQNLTHDGIFRPWLDKSCLEILQKM
ncbi:uncharacterized protein LOC133314703 [Gastrolobium bilobum]|uniref:uncharacterized protein LOC133314703 n=1 Tax=Gastrolobium bilobum TaxID=150636 RepID=UPI002AB08EE2|nr:uncharacterized protein LOC133314703 [Gastrolobium bilobum]